MDKVLSLMWIADPSNINYGQQLWVPQAPSVMTAAPAGKVPGLAAPATANSSFTETYTVVKGDNLWNLAKKFGTTVNELTLANNISDPSKLRIDEQLHVLPAASSAPSATPNSTAPTSPTMPASPGTAPSGQ